MCGMSGLGDALGLEGTRRLSLGLALVGGTRGLGDVLGLEGL